MVFQGTMIPDPDSVTLSIPTLDLDSQDNSLLDSTTTSVTSVSSLGFRLSLVPRPCPAFCHLQYCK